MFDIGYGVFEPALSQTTRKLPVWKRAMDIVICMVLLVPLVGVALVLLILNPFCNAGPLIYRADRMGAGLQSFRMLKFRTMSAADHATRGAFEQVEAQRITALGRWLRRSRVDELPQIVNVLRGEMTLIGPRPDCYHHALVYVREIPGYARRYAMLPGISGLAQTEVGYAQTARQIRRKVAADMLYLRRVGIAMDMWITVRTLSVVLRLRGG